MSKRMLNVRGDDRDLFYAYKMPALQTKMEGRGLSLKTVLINISEIAKYLRTKPEYIIKFFGLEICVLSKYDHKRNSGIIQGVHQTSQLQLILKTFIKEFILCSQCTLPELQYRTQKTKRVLRQKCAACGWKGNNASNHKLKKYIIKHRFNHITSYRKEITFLRGCNNFKTIEHNFELLLYGYIRINTNDKDLYHLVPLDIIYIIFNISYIPNCKYFKQLKDVFDSEHIVEWNNKYGTVFELNETKNILKLINKCEKPQIAFGRYVLTNELIRKVWRIKVLKNKSENNKGFSFVICITECDNDDAVQCEFIANERIVDDDGYYYYSNVKEGDIISLLFINYSTKRSKVLIQFGINDVIYPKKFDTTNIDLRRKKYKVALKMSQKEELQMFH